MPCMTSHPFRLMADSRVKWVFLQCIGALGLIMESIGALSVKETEGKATPERFRITYEARQIDHHQLLRCKQGAIISELAHSPLLQHLQQGALQQW